MKLKKQAKEFNTYTAEFTYGELKLLQTALHQSPGLGPEADEMLEGFSFYLDKMPEPGEEPESKETSNTPDMQGDMARDSLEPIELDAPPGDGPAEEPETTPNPEGDDDDGDETLADRLPMKRGEKKDEPDMELPEPPSE
jgi:hypothetical protein